MKAVALFLCLLGPAFAIPTHPFNYKLGTHGQKTPEKREDLHPEASREGNADKGALLPHQQALNLEVPGPDAEPQTTRKEGRFSSQHQVKNSLKSTNLLAPHNKPGRAADSQEGDSGSSSREQPSPEHEEHSNTASRHALGKAGPPLGALSLQHELQLWKHNPNAIGLAEESSESDEGGEGVEEEDEEVNYRDVKHEGLQPSLSDQYKRQQKENALQAAATLRGANSPILRANREREEFHLEDEEEREKVQKEASEEEIPLSQRAHSKEQGETQQSQEPGKLQVDYQSDDSTAGGRQGKEGRGGGADRGHEHGEEGLSNTWQEAAYEEEEAIQRNDQEQRGAGATEEGTAAQRETEDSQGGKRKGSAHSEQEDGKPEPLPSDSQKQEDPRSSAQSLNSMESEDQVKSPGSSHSEMERASTRSQLALLDPCRNFHCRKGKVCQVDKQGRANCTCQDPAACPSTKDYEHVRKIYQDEQRLAAGEHAVELLLHDFQQNYHMYVYPVHWQFHQLDQHPADRLLTHSELAPLRASLVPMEHCITRFFQECDGDQDKLIALKEWCHCFGIKEEDINESLLF
ncbi:SPARC-like protein 1 isoform X2 [Pogoniulus pusillus]|uniref:SPARC-like protein 1 isoform X2 n=1 Tax=Pogoniulus pusillus TaxID=488313 RepID=UPI0030B9914B